MGLITRNNHGIIPVEKGLRRISQNQSLLWKLLRVTQILKISHVHFLEKKIVIACEEFVWMTVNENENVIAN